MVPTGWIPDACISFHIIKKSAPTGPTGWKPNLFPERFTIQRFFGNQIGCQPVGSVFVWFDAGAQNVKTWATQKSIRLQPVGNQIDFHIQRTNTVSITLHNPTVFGAPLFGLGNYFVVFVESLNETYMDVTYGSNRLDTGRMHLVPLSWTYETLLSLGAPSDITF